MTAPVSNIVIVGGGSAGWLTAGLLASEWGPGPDAPVRVTLIESPDVPTIGVGEGTWPTMRVSLQKMGIPEAEFLGACSASFKQGTRFSGWVSGAPEEAYYHPFSLPAGFGEINLAPHWQEQETRGSFVDAVTVQGYLCDRHLAPKQAATPDYAFVANYGYHLDAGAFAELLRRHCTERLGVRHLRANVTGVNPAENGEIAAVTTADAGTVAGDLFVDCTGFRALLLGEHYGVPFIDRGDVLFNDTALALQVPYARADGAIASQTNATAARAGWIWDIALQTRRGVGYTYSSAHSSEEAARAVLRDYLAASGGDADLEPRRITFRSGHRETLWHRNCVAVGMAAGFLEPLEASALVMVELAAQAIAEALPAERQTLDVVARRYNDKFRYRWDRVIDFLKLHYVLSRREDSDYWADHRRGESVPGSLAELLALWRSRPLAIADLPQIDEVFSGASHQYVLSGMGFESPPRRTARWAAQSARAQQLIRENSRAARRMVEQLPGNRELLTRLTARAQAGALADTHEDSR